jgi:hypothetical protein
MPWNIEDVDKFKKGLSKKQKERWVRIANKVLETCKSDDGTDCEAKAIKQANGVLGNNEMETYKLQVNNYEVEVKQFNGRDHLVIPVVMMVDGVHRGSMGSLLHVKEELEKYTAAWNGRPVVIQHPQIDGEYVSANLPNVLESEEVGKVFNTRYDAGLKAEAWLDIEKLKKVSIETYNLIENRNVLEVSIGVFSDVEENVGVYNDTEYEGIARNYRPDHLAILNFTEGACNRGDGCGLGVNKKEENKMDLTVYTKDTGFQIIKNGKEVTPCDFLKYIAKEGKHSIEVNKLDYTDRLDVIRQKLYSLEDIKNDVYCYLDTVYDNYFVYKNINTYFKQNYSINLNDDLVLEGEPVQVKKQIDFVPVNNIETNKGETMAEKEKKPQTEKVEETQVNAEVVDREELKKEIMANLATEVNTENGMAKVFGSEFAKQVNFGLKTYRKKFNELVEEITTNSKIYTKEELASKDIEDLEKLNSFIQDNKKSDYTGMNAGASNFQVDENHEEEPLLPMGVTQKGDK